MVRTQFSKIFKAIRIDNGTEFVNHETIVLFQKLGILHQKTCPYTPQENGKVERKHRHLLEVAISLMIQSNFPSKFWGDSILMATHIINMLLSSLLDWKTPYQLLYQKPSNYNHLKTFGWLCFATNTLPHKDKFVPRAYKCIFLGYTLGQKAYKVYDIDNNRIYISRDVVFHEKKISLPKYYPHQRDYSISIPLSFDQDFPNTNTQPLNIDNTAPIHEILETHSPIISFPINSRTNQQSLPPSPHLRKSTRATHKPIWLQDFISHVQYSTFNQPLAEISTPTGQAYTHRHILLLLIHPCLLHIWLSWITCFLLRNLTLLSKLVLNKSGFPLCIKKLMLLRQTRLGSLLIYLQESKLLDVTRSINSSLNLMV